MAAIGVTDPASCVFVGDRPIDDIHGAAGAGLRTVLIPNSSVPGHDGAVPDAVITRLSDLLPVLSAF
jgi:putative hydrolase of the HAD superfamily